MRAFIIKMVNSYIYTYTKPLKQSKSVVVLEVEAENPEILKKKAKREALLYGISRHIHNIDCEYMKECDIL